MNQLDVPAKLQGELQRLVLDGGLLEGSGLDRGTLSLGLIVARNQMSRGDNVGALRTYSILVLLDAKNIDFQLGLSNCAWHVGEAEVSLQAASAAVALAPRNPRGYFFSGRACLTLGHGAEAKEDLEDAVALGRQTRDASIVQDANALLRTL